jgi:hypothetical protein
MKILGSLEISNLGSKIFPGLTYPKQQKTNFSVKVFVWRKNEAQHFVKKVGKLLRVFQCVDDDAKKSC